MISTTGIFSDTPAADSSVTGASLTTDLQDQVTQLQDYQNSMSSLEGKVVSGSLLTKLQNQGPAATQQLQALNSMTYTFMFICIMAPHQNRCIISTKATCAHIFSKFSIIIVIHFSGNIYRTTLYHF